MNNLCQYSCIFFSLEQRRLWNQSSQMKLSMKQRQRCVSFSSSKKKMRVILHQGVCVWGGGGGGGVSNKCLNMRRLSLLNLSVSPFGLFYRPKWQISLPFYILPIVKSQSFHVNHLPEKRVQLPQDCQMVHQYGHCLIFLEHKCGSLWCHVTMLYENGRIWLKAN